MATLGLSCGASWIFVKISRNIIDTCKFLHWKANSHFLKRNPCFFQAFLILKPVDLTKEYERLQSKKIIANNYYYYS
jgi:hypothetical protein